MTEVVPRVDGFGRATKDLIDRLEREGYSPKTLEGYAYAMHRARVALAELGTPPSPSRFGERHARHLEECLARVPWILRDIDVCLRHLKAPRGVRYTIPPRRRVDWLNVEQQFLVLDTAMQMGMPYAAAIHMELQLGFRRASVCRATVRDLTGNLVYVRGKPTPQGDYSIPPHPRMPEILRWALEWRAERGWTDVEVLLPARSNKFQRTGPYSESGMDGIVAKVVLESGVKFSNHTLRRSFGRSLWQAGVKIETISRMLGHDDVSTTIHYLGINLDDMSSGMDALARFQSAPQLYLKTGSQ